MTKETLQKDLEKVLNKEELLFTRLRTPQYGYRGVRYPADYVLWFPNGTFLVECKQRKKLPLVPSDIRQLPFMKQWVESSNIPQAGYLILVSVEDGYYLFGYESAVIASESHKGLKADDAIMYSPQLRTLIKNLFGGKNDSTTEINI